MVLASVEDNCPMVVLEAMAAGLPVAATRAGGIPELIEDGKTGLLMDLADGRQMQEVVKCLCDDLERLGAMGAAARRVAELRHHPDRVAERHVELYRSLMKHPRKGEGEHPAR
jgi:glycosyltransferase involved in cell wall biosynthesis